MSVEINETNFPDAGFRSYISENFDTDNDGWLSDSELANMASINISEKNDIYSIQGIELISTLKNLSVQKCSNITSISIISHPSLEDLRIYKLPALTTAVIRDNSHLDYVGLWASINLATVTIQNCPELVELWCGTFDTQSEYYTYSLSSFTISGVPKLEKLWILKGQLTSLDLSACTSLKNFQAYGNTLTSINLGDIRNLEIISIGNNNLSSLNLPPCSVSQQIQCNQNNLISVDVSKSPVLVSTIKQNNPSQMTITGYPTRYGNTTCHIIVDSTVIVVLEQPVSQTASDGTIVIFSTEAKGNNITYQWQVSRDNSTWSNLADATSNTYSRVASVGTDGDQYRCIIADSNGNSVTSQAATLTLRSPEDPPVALAIITQPTSQTVSAGGSVSFSIEAQGDNLIYRWEYCLPNAQNWIYADSDSSSIVIPNIDSDHNGVQYHCIVTDGNGDSLTSNAVTITVSSIGPGTDPNPGTDDDPTPGDTTFKIVRQPKNTTAISGAEVTFTVVAQGVNLLYQWQFSSDSGSNWLNVQSDGNSNVYTFMAGDAQNGYLFHCVITDGIETLTTDSVRLTVRNLPASPERKTYLPSEMAAAIRQLGLAGIDLDDIPFGNMPDGLAITTLGSRGATSPEWYEEIAEAINVLKDGIDIEDNQIFKVKNITENGEYVAVEDDCYGYTLVDVDVFGGDSIVDRTVSELYINDKITTVGAYAFYSCESLPAVDVPNCSRIEDCAFMNCTSLSSINAPNCSFVGYSAFQNCNGLSSISLPNCITLGGYAFSSCFTLSSIDFPVCKTVGAGAFWNCRSLTSVFLPDCSLIEDSVFRSCSGLLSIEMPSCKTIGAAAFSDCRNLAEVSFPECTRVNDDAFYECSLLASIALPKCSYIGWGAFRSCQNLSSLYLYGSSVCRLAGPDALASTAIVSGNGWIYVPPSLYSAYVSARYWSIYSSRIYCEINVAASMNGMALELSGAGATLSSNSLLLSDITVSMSGNQLVLP